MLLGRVSRKITLAHTKTNSSIFSYQTWLELKMGLASMVRWKKTKTSFLAANIQDGFVNTGIKLGCIFYVVGLYFYWRSWTSCLDTWHHGFYQMSTDKNQYATDSVRNIIIGHVWIFQPDNNPNTNLKNNTQMPHWAQNQASAMTIPVLWPEPCRKWVSWIQEKKHHHGAVNLKGLEWFWMKEWSLISSGVL